MEHEDPLNEDERMAVLFRSVDAPAPSFAFVTRTMRAVKREPLPLGRRRLRNPVTLVAGWAAVLAGVSLSATMIALDEPIFASTFAELLSDGIATGMWLTQFAGTGLTLLDVFATTGSAVSRAVFTGEGFAALMLMSMTGAVSLSVLHRLLMLEGSERGVSQWQEL